MCIRDSPEEALKMCDENTICIVPIQGVTWTGLNDDVEALDKACLLYTSEILVHTVKIALLACKGDDVGGVHTVLLVVHVALMNAALVGMIRDTIIGHADSHPYVTAHTGSLANHLHNPDFVGVGNRERLAAAVITVFMESGGAGVPVLFQQQTAAKTQML